jgi:hypothetical protein
MGAAPVSSAVAAPRAGNSMHLSAAPAVAEGPSAEVAVAEGPSEAADAAAVDAAVDEDDEEVQHVVCS